MEQKEIQQEDQQKAVKKQTKNKQKQNQILYQYFVRKEFGQCMSIIEQMNQLDPGQHEYANFLKALILRIRGDLNDSLNELKFLHEYNDKNYEVLKEICRSMFLTGKYRASIEVANQAIQLNPNDWELFYTSGLCYVNTKDYKNALEQFKKANKISKNQSIYVQLGKLYCLMDQQEEAIKIYEEALEQSHESSEILTILGIMQLRQGNNMEAFQHLGSALALENKNQKAILALSSIMQDRSEYDAAINKYRIMAQQNQNSAQLWNNLGMCFYGKQQYIAAIACLKKSFYLNPFEWICCHNLGLVYLATLQYAIAFYFFTVSINLKQNFATSYMHLGICLNKLEDFPNACQAMRKSLELDKDYLTYLNFSIILAQRGEQYFNEAKEMFNLFEEKFQSLDEDTRIEIEEVNLQRIQLSKILKINLKNQ